MPLAGPAGSVSMPRASTANVSPASPANAGRTADAPRARATGPEPHSPGPPAPGPVTPAGRRELRAAGGGRGMAGSGAGPSRVRQAKTTVREPFSRTRCSLCHFTARASAWHSTSRPTATSWSGVTSWPTRSTSCSMIGPSSRSAVT